MSSNAFKDWFDRKAAKALARQIASAWSPFDEKRFVQSASKGLDALEMMDRVRQFSRSLRANLPEDVPDALAVIVESLPPLLPDTESVTDGWLQWPLGEFIANYGVEHFEPSMAAMHALTQRFSAEFAIRPFVERTPKKTFMRLKKWTGDPSPHVRRWCSEGIRPRLPWGGHLRALIADPSPIFPILERLKDDDSEYVRRSVANNLNDIAKDHPERVLETCSRWSKNASRDRARLIKHGLRTLVKAGHPEALAILGFGPPDRLAARLRVSPKTVKVGEGVQLALTIENEGEVAASIMVDYAIHYRLAKGGFGRKVFKWCSTHVPAGDRVELTKSHPMKKVTIRTLRGGMHPVEVQLNGKVLAKGRFTLEE